MSEKVVVLVCGSRTIVEYSIVDQELRKHLWGNNYVDPERIEFISGRATGVDTLAKQFANINNIPIIEHPANWRKYGKSAGYIRNAHMVKLADMVIAIWDGQSKGTLHTINLGHKKGIPVYVSNLGVSIG